MTMSYKADIWRREQLTVARCSTFLKLSEVPYAQVIYASENHKQDCLLSLQLVLQHHSSTEKPLCHATQQLSTVVIRLFRRDARSGNVTPIL